MLKSKIIRKYPQVYDQKLVLFFISCGALKNPKKYIKEINRFSAGYLSEFEQLYKSFLSCGFVMNLMIMLHKYDKIIKRNVNIHMRLK
jgi:hypothetical protein